MLVRGYDVGILIVVTVLFSRFQERFHTLAGAVDHVVGNVINDESDAPVPKRFEQTHRLGHAIVVVNTDGCVAERFGWNVHTDRRHIGDTQFLTCGFVELERRNDDRVSIAIFRQLCEVTLRLLSACDKCGRHVVAFRFQHFAHALQHVGVEPFVEFAGKQQDNPHGFPGRQRRCAFR